MHLALGVCAGLAPVSAGACGVSGPAAMSGLAGALGAAGGAGAAASGLSGAAGGVAGSVLGAGIASLFSGASQWAVAGALWLLAQVGTVLSSSTVVELGSKWFVAHETVMAGLAAAVVVPMACAAAIQAVYRQSASTLLRSFLVYLPLSLLLTGVAVTLVRLALVVTDSLSARVLAGAGPGSAHLLSGLSAALGSGTAGAPAFVVLAGALLVAAGALVLWLELAVRAAAVSAAVLFLPLALAALVWPAVSHWCRRLADTLAALVLSKLVVAGVLSLGAAALASGIAPSGAGGGGFAAVVTGVALLLLATLAPFTLLRLVPAVEAGAVAHLEGARHRVQGTARAAALTGGDVARELAGAGPGGRVGSAAGTGAMGGPAAAAAVGTAGAARMAAEAARIAVGATGGVGPGDGARGGDNARGGGVASRGVRSDGVAVSPPLEEPAMAQTTWDRAENLLRTPGGQEDMSTAVGSSRAASREAGDSTVPAAAPPSPRDRRSGNATGTSAPAP